MTVVVAGEALVDLILRPDGSITAVPGGGPYNAARTLARLGIETVFVDPDEPENFARAITPKTKELYAETLGNPSLNVLDIEAVARIADQAGLRGGVVEAAQLQLELLARLFVGRHLLRRGLDAVVHGVAEQVKEGVGDLLEERPVDLDLGAGDETGIVAGEEQGRTGGVTPITHETQGNPGQTLSQQGIHIAALLWRCGISKSGQVDGQYTNTLQHQWGNGANPMCPTAAATV